MLDIDWARRNAAVRTLANRIHSGVALLGKPLGRKCANP